MNNTFEVTVTMDKSGENADPQAELIGDTTVMFTNVSTFAVYAFCLVCAAFFVRKMFTFEFGSPTVIFGALQTCPTVEVGCRAIGFGAPKGCPTVGLVLKFAALFFLY